MKQICNLNAASHFQKSLFQFMYYFARCLADQDLQINFVPF